MSPEDWKKVRFERRTFWQSERKALKKSNGRARLSEKHGVFELGCLILKCAKRYGEKLDSRPCEERLERKLKAKRSETLMVRGVEREGHD